MPSIEEDDTCGEWIDIKLEFGIRSYKCSICNHICQAYSLKTFDPPPYCMYCGSKMINGRDNDAETR